MIRQPYIEFVEKFEELTPYELNHFCKVVHEHYQVVSKLADGQPRPLNTSEMLEIIIQAMHAIQVELAENRLNEAERTLKRVKTKVYKRQLENEQS